MRALLIITSIVLTINSGQAQPKSTTSMSNPKNDKIVVYQIFTRLFGNKNTTNNFFGSHNENGVGKFNDINDKALSEIKKMGISHVWFTGVIEHATMTDYSSFGIAKDNPLVVKGKAGSPYAIKDYYDVNPDLAIDVPSRMAEFEALVARSHTAGLQVVIDFVPNHVARQYQSDAKPKNIKDFGETDNKTQTFNAQNNFYYLPNQPFQTPDNIPLPEGIKPEPYTENPAKATGNDVFLAKPSVNDWFETIKLNYGVDYQNGRQTHFDPIPNTWLKMRDILSYWSHKGVDAFRCDMAEMVPVEFWGWVIPEIQKLNPKVIFIAEIYNPKEYANYLFKGKFDYLYDKVGLYDALRRLIEGGGNANDITGVWQNESGEFSNRMLRFLENHDEQRIASQYFGHNGFAAIPSLVLSATLHTGPLMLYFGQELGVNPTQAEGFQGNDGRTTIFDYWGVPEFQAWVNGGKYDGGKLTNEQKKLRKIYIDVLKLVNTSDAVQRGSFYDLQWANRESKNYNNNKIYSYLRHTNKQKLLIVCNFDKQNSYETTLQIPAHAYETMGIKTDKKLNFEELLFHKSLKLTAKNELNINLAPNSVYVFEIK
jgi:glycosidase